MTADRRGAWPNSRRRTTHVDLACLTGTSFPRLISRCYPLFQPHTTPQFITHVSLDGYCLPDALGIQTWALTEMSRKRNRAAMNVVGAGTYTLLGSLSSCMMWVGRPGLFLLFCSFNVDSA